MPTPKKKDPEAELDEGQAEEAPVDETPRTADSSTSEAPGDAAQGEDHPRPWRVETFSVGEDGWGWRLAAANGVALHESETNHESKDAAVKAAQDDDRTEGAVFHDLDRRTRS